MEVLVGMAFGAAEPPKNIAHGRLCQVFSSYEADGWSVRNLTDGETGAIGWSSKAFALYPDHRLYPEYVIVDLGTDCEIRSVVLHPRGDGTTAGKGFPLDFTIQVCDEGEPWRVAVKRLGFPEPPGAQPVAWCASRNRQRESWKH